MSEARINDNNININSSYGSRRIPFNNDYIVQIENPDIIQHRLLSLTNTMSDFSATYDRIMEKYPGSTD